MSVPREVLVTVETIAVNVGAGLTWEARRELLIGFVAHDMDVPREPSLFRNFFHKFHDGSIFPSVYSIRVQVVPVRRIAWKRYLRATATTVRWRRQGD